MVYEPFFSLADLLERCRFKACPFSAGEWRCSWDVSEGQLHFLFQVLDWMGWGNLGGQIDSVMKWKKKTGASCRRYNLQLYSLLYAEYVQSSLLAWAQSTEPSCLFLRLNMERSWPHGLYSCYACAALLPLKTLARIHCHMIRPWHRLWLCFSSKRQRRLPEFWSVSELQLLF